MRERGRDREYSKFWGPFLTDRHTQTHRHTKPFLEMFTHLKRKKRKKEGERERDRQRERDR